MQRKSRPRPSEEQRARCLSSRRRCGKRKQLMQQLAQRGGASSWHPASRCNRLQCGVASESSLCSSSLKEVEHRVGTLPADSIACNAKRAAALARGRSERASLWIGSRTSLRKPEAVQHASSWFPVNSGKGNSGKGNSGKQRCTGTCSTGGQGPLNAKGNFGKRRSAEMHRDVQHGRPGAR